MCLCTQILPLLKIRFCFILMLVTSCVRFQTPQIAANQVFVHRISRQDRQQISVLCIIYHPPVPRNQLFPQKFLRQALQSSMEIKCLSPFFPNIQHRKNTLVIITNIAQALPFSAVCLCVIFLIIHRSYSCFKHSSSYISSFFRLVLGILVS